MYRSGTVKFLESLTPFKSFTDDKLTEIRSKNYYKYKYELYKIESNFISDDLGRPPVCYTNYDNIDLKKILCDSYIRMLDKPINIKNHVTKDSIRDLLEQYTNDPNPSYYQKSLGICLYKVNLDDFKITKYKYIHEMGLLYDVLNSYENCNYFIKIIDANRIIYTFADKLIINSFIKLLYSYVECHSYTTHYVVTNVVLIILYYLFFQPLLQFDVIFSKITNDFEIIRNEFKNKRTTSSLQINFKKTFNYLLTWNQIPNDILLKWFINNNNTLGNSIKSSKKFFRINNYRDVNKILHDLDIYWDRIYKNFIIYEKDTSYYIYKWLYLLIVYIHYIQRNTVDAPILPKNIIDLDISILFNSLKNYEKSKYFIMKDDFNNKIFNNGIVF